jgi:hypothetical protein
MDRKLAQIKQIRLFLLREISNLTSEQLNAIPQGYNNNIIWNLAHMLSAMQALCYKRAGLPVTIDDKYVTPFLPGTRPETIISDDEIAAIKLLLINTTDKLQADIENNLFHNYTMSERVEQVYGIQLLSIDDAIDFLMYHEGFHSGYIMALKHLV